MWKVSRKDLGNEETVREVAFDILDRIRQVEALKPLEDLPAFTNITT